MEPIRSMWNYGEKSGWFKAKGIGRESSHHKPTDHKAKEESSMGYINSYLVTQGALKINAVQ